MHLSSRMRVGINRLQSKVRTHATKLPREADHAPGSRPAPNEGLEERLLKHVLTTTPRGSPAAVIAAVDSFAWGGEWMMNVGDRKGTLLDNEVRKVVTAGGVTFLEVSLDGGFVRTKLQMSRSQAVGTYCGYSATRIASLFARPGSTLYSLEYNPANASIARQLISHAGLNSSVKVMNGTVGACSQLLRDAGVMTFDLIFLDQWKEQYIPDLKILMEQGFLHRGTVVVADNLVFPGNPEYIKWMESDPDFTFTLHKTKLEYSETIEDAVGVSVFVGASRAKQ